MRIVNEYEYYVYIYISMYVYIDTETPNTKHPQSSYSVDMYLVYIV